MVFNKRYKIENTKAIAARKRFEKQKLDPAFRRWYAARLRKQHGLCFYCFKDISSIERHIEHMMPLWRGGNNRRINLVISCRECNIAKGIKPIGTREQLQLRQKFNKEVNDILEAEKLFNLEDNVRHIMFEE